MPRVAELSVQALNSIQRDMDNLQEEKELGGCYLSETTCFWMRSIVAVIHNDKCNKMIIMYQSKCRIEFDSPNSEDASTMTFCKAVVNKCDDRGEVVSTPVFSEAHTELKK
jgi:hypothetical protein